VRKQTPTPSVTMYAGRVRTGLFALISLMFTAGGVFLALSGESDDMGIAVATIVLFGACLLVFLHRMFTRRPVLVLDEQGITNRTSLSRPRFLPWSEIVGLHEARRGPGQSWIAVSVRDPERVLVGAGVLARVNYRMGGGAMYIMTTALPLSIDDTMREIAMIAPDHVDVPGRHWPP
jgi:hypothetical protein